MVGMTGLADSGRNEPGQHTRTALEKKQALLAHLVRMVARGVSHGLFVAGSGGTGKSYTISRLLAEEGVQPVLLNSHVTALSLYQVLFEHRKDRVLWLDDVDGCFASMPVLGILRSALWSAQGERIVTYSSTQLRGLPSRFAFDSRIILCANSFPRRNEAFNAVLTRIDQFRMDLSNEEVIEHMRKLAARGHGILSSETCLEVVDYIEQAGGTRQLSMRLFEPSLHKVAYALANDIDWRTLVRCQLDQISRSQHEQEHITSRVNDLEAMAQAIAAHSDNVQAQLEHWQGITGKSRASFFRAKRRYEETVAHLGVPQPSAETAVNVEYFAEVANETLEIRALS